MCGRRPGQDPLPGQVAFNHQVDPEALEREVQVGTSGDDETTSSESRIVGHLGCRERWHLEAFHGFIGLNSASARMSPASRPLKVSTPSPDVSVGRVV